MVDVLSQGEVDALLAAVGGSETESPEASVKFKYYDFARPERDNLDPLGRAENFLSGLEHSIGEVIGGMCASSMTARFEGISSKSFKDFIARLPDPSCVATIEPTRSGGCMVMEINGAILYPILTTLLGGTSGMEGEIPVRKMTRIEKQLFEGILKELLKSFSKRLPEATEELTLARLDTSPGALQIAEPTEAVMVAEYEVVVDSRGGVMRIAAPKSLMERMFAIRREREAHVSPKNVEREELEQLNTALAVSEVRVKVVSELQAGNMSLRQLSLLETGSNIYAGAKPGGVKLAVGGIDKFDAELIEAENLLVARVVAARAVYNREEERAE